MTEDDSVPSGARPPASTGVRTWKCMTCQFRVTSEIIPFRCPRCGASRVKMQELAAASSGEAET